MFTKPKLIDSKMISKINKDSLKATCQILSKIYCLMVPPLTIKLIVKITEKDTIIYLIMSPSQIPERVK